MKLSDLWSPMSDLTQQQKDVSNRVVGGSLAMLGLVMFVAAPLAANAQRMATPYDVPSGGFTLPGKPVPPPAAPTAPPQSYAPAPAPQQAPRPAPAPQVHYPTFRPFGPLPEGRVTVRVDSTFEAGQIFGFPVMVQDNGTQGNDQMVINGPDGQEQVWINCWQTREWASYGPNSQQFVDSIVSRYCGWDNN